MDRITGVMLIIFIVGVFIGGLILYSEQRYGKVYNATTKQEFREACEQFTVRSAPIKCLELYK